MNLSNNDLARIKKHSGKKTPEGVAKMVKASQKWEVSAENRDLLWDCRQDWEAMRSLREEHRRNQRYKNGHQWDDLMVDPDDPTKMIREKEYISRQGKTAIQNNLIQQIDRNILGQMISNPTQPVVVSRSEDDTEYGEMLTNTLQYGLELNKYNILKKTALSYLASAGLCVAKVRYGVWSTKNRSDVFVDMINVNRFFFNQDAEDPRLSDIYRMGEIHDYTWNELKRDFYTGSEADMRALREEYASVLERARNQETNRAEDNLDNLDFYGSANNNKYRVFEVWRKCVRVVEYVHDKAKGEELFDEVHGKSYYDNINAQRISQMMAYGIDEETINSQLIEHHSIAEEYWEARWLTPNGTCLKRMETPYDHQGAPYVIGYMPRIDGVIKPLYSHVTETNRTINRHATLIDFSIASSAKGCLMVPKSMLQHTPLKEIARQYSRTDGILVYDDSKAVVERPTQLATNAIPAGAFEFLNLEIQQLKEISGLSGALSGQASRSGTPSSLYAQQAQNSMLNFVLLFDCFADFNKEVAEKVLKTQMQYYTTKRHVDISGQIYNKTAIYYEPQVVDKIIDWNIVVAEGADTPVFRQMHDEMLKYLFDAGAINVELLLENSSAPFAKKLLAQVRTAQQQMQQGQMAGAQQQMEGVDMSQIQADPNSLKMVQELYNNNIATVPIQQPNVEPAA
jgi:hypothetical protein